MEDNFNKDREGGPSEETETLEVRRDSENRKQSEWSSLLNSNIQAKTAMMLQLVNMGILKKSAEKILHMENTSYSDEEEA